MVFRMHFFSMIVIKYEPDYSFKSTYKEKKKRKKEKHQYYNIPLDSK